MIGHGFALLSVGAALAGLTWIAVRGPYPEAAHLKGDRSDLFASSASCRGRSFMAACAGASETGRLHPALLQVFTKPETTVLVRVRLGD
jgi:hypothetical protein